MTTDRIDIIGMACRLPGARTAEALWRSDSSDRPFVPLDPLRIDAVGFPFGHVLEWGRNRMAARRLAHAGLIAGATPAALGQRVPARLTPAGHQELLAG